MGNRLGMGMIGGGIDSFIGEVHRMAARLDNQIDLVCGAFSSSKHRSMESGKMLGLPLERVYGSFPEMLAGESASNHNPKMDFVSIVTPNHLHFEPAKLALQAGFHVLVDKPLCFSLEEAYELRNLASTSGKIFGITYTYTGYPMVKEARALIQKGSLGKIRKVNVDYPQGWLTKEIEAENQKQASWRVNPAMSGKGGAMGDIGTHAENIIHYVSSLEIDELSADLHSQFSRQLDDDATIMLRFTNGATGSVRASQVLAGEENALKISVHGELGSLHWSHTIPNVLRILRPEEPAQILTSGVDKSYLSEHALRNTRLPAGHPEGFIEAFATIYRNFAYAIQTQKNIVNYDSKIYDYPGIDAGIRGMAFIEKVIESSSDNGKWKKFHI